MSILKYKDPKTGEFKRLNPYKADLTFVGKDGITIKKVADSEKIEISGSGLVPNTTKTGYVVYTKENNVNSARIFAMQPNPNSFPVWNSNNELEGAVTSSASDNTLTNKKYVADNYVEKVKFTNLEQALNGYILDTTKEAYADLDSAVLKDSVSVGDNVYPIADKTRALLTRIEGKTTKMVQLLDKSTFPATKTEDGITYTNNGDGTITVNGTATAVTAYVAPDFRMVLGHKYLLVGCPSGGGFGIGYTHSIHQKDSNGETKYWADNGEGKIFTSVGTSGLWVLAVYLGNPTVDNKLFMPNLFDLTAMNREDITTVEQFKAEFPELYYPYENGNLYPAKISGVKFYEKQDKSGEQASVTLPETYDLHGIDDYKDYLEITKNENNELYTLKKVQSVEVDESEKTITPLATPVETVIATNLTYEQVTAIRHNGGLIEVEGNPNKGYARPTIKNTVVYRLTATNTAEG